MKSEIRIVVGQPPVHWYRKMRDANAWREVTEHAATAGLENSLFSVCAMRDDEIVGCGRVIGDGAM